MVDSLWERRRILIWGKTRPELSKSYREIVCTGGVFADTGSLVRLYPIPLRYLDDEHYFAKYQWIEADVQRTATDARPESYRVRAVDIIPLNKVPSGGTWAARAKWVLQPQNLVASVELLQQEQVTTRRSLGVLKPKEIITVDARPVTTSEIANFWNRYHELLAQPGFAFTEERPIKPLGAPEYRFQIAFRCDDPACAKPHTFSVLDWEVDALYHTLKNRRGAEHLAVEGVLDHLRNVVCSSDRDTRFFLGNIASHPQVFTIVGLWYPELRDRDGQGNLFSPE